jgi:hypothetical protein
MVNNDEFERIWKKAVVAYFNALPFHSTEKPEKHHEELYSGYSVYWPRFEWDTSQIQARSIAALANVLCVIPASILGE